MKNQTKTKIRVESVVKTKVGELENITREGIIRRMRKEVVGFVQSVVGNKNFIVFFRDSQKIEIISYLIVFLSLKEGVEKDKAILYSPKKEQSELLTVVGDPEVGKPCMFGKGVYLSSVYCLCYVKDISIYMLEDQVAEERNPYLNEEEDIRMDAIRKEHQRNVSE